MKYIKVILILIGLSIFSICYAAEKVILNLPGVGTVKANPATHQLIFTAENPGIVPMEFSVCWNELNWNEQKGWYEGSQKCIQSEAGGWQLPQFTSATKIVPLPHYKTVTITIGRYDKLATAICRENDGIIGCTVLYQKSFYVSNCKEAHPGNPLIPITLSGNNIIPPSETVNISGAAQITIKPSMIVASGDVGKQAILLMYIAQSNGGGKLLSSSSITLGNTVEFDFNLECIPVTMLSFPVTVYVGYRLSDGTIKYNGYIINK